MNFANKLTLSRIGLTFLMMTFIFSDGLMSKILAFVFFLLACLTDFLDGWVARKWSQISDFGKIMDPVADKILVLGAFLSFVELRLIPAWMVVIVIFREFLITGLRFWAMRSGKILAAEKAGKHKTVSQMLTIAVILIFLIFRESQKIYGVSSVQAKGSFEFWILALMTLTVVLTLYSGLSYLWQNRKLIKSL